MKTKIEWTDYSWNFVTGCNKVSAGCKNCYAETIANRFWKDRKFTDVQIDEGKLSLPLHLKKPRMIFVNSMSDLFHEKISFETIDKAFAVMHGTPKHTYQILTKRPQKMLEFFNLKSMPCPDNVWLGVSVENQQTADERMPLLLQTPAAVRWLSVEPMLEKIDLDPAQMFMDMVRGRETIDWIVIGCESGHNRRDCKTEWVESIVGQCKRANVPVFIKQIQINGKVIKDINQFPKHLQIREYPIDGSRRKADSPEPGGKE